VPATGLEIDRDKLTLGRREYEVSNHLGNVLAVVSDAKLPAARVLSHTDYYAFGSAMPGRSGGANYRYGFNGKENDKDFGNAQLIQDYGFRLYNPAIGKFLSVDPLTASYPFYTPYQFAGNMPIWAIDLDGAEPLFQTSYKRLLEKGVTVVFGEEMVVSYTFRGSKVHASIVVDGPEATTLKASSKLGALWHAPKALWHYDEGNAIKNLSDKRAWDGAPGGLFYSLALHIDKVRSLSSKGERETYDYANTILHVTGQTLSTMLFGEGATQYYGDMHERKPAEEYQCIMSGQAVAAQSSFSGPLNGVSGKSVEYFTVDQIKDVFNNQIGRILGGELARKHNVSSATIWTNQMTANVLNDIMGMFTSEYPNIKFRSFDLTNKDDAAIIQSATDRINAEMSSYREGYPIIKE
jgi:RHS repeat-associated protein